MVKTERVPTRERLIDATLRLVAERGFDGVSVGDIESSAGLSPRSGALYKYFDSKLAVLEAGLEAHLVAVADVELESVNTPPSDVLPAVEFLARWLLAELDRERLFTHVIEREGDRLPTLRDLMRTGIADRGYRLAATLLRTWTRQAGRADRFDHEAVAVLLVGSLINLRRATWTLGEPPIGLDDERVIETFVDVSATLLGLERS